MFLVMGIFYSCRQGSDTYRYRAAQPRMVSILVLASNKLNSGQLKGSINFLDSCFRTLEDPGPVDLWEKYHFKAKIYLLYDIDLLKAKSHLDSMQGLIEGKEEIYNREYAHTKFIEGDYLKSQNRFMEAFQSYYEGRSFAQENLDSCQISNLTYQLGLFRYGQRQYEEAIPYVKQAFMENQKCPETGDLEQNLKFPQMYLNTLGLSYEKINQLDSAAFYYHETLSFLEDKKQSFPDSFFFIEMAKGVVYGNLGGAMAKKNQLKKAEQYLLESIGINEQPGYDNRDAQTAKIKIIDLYLEKNEIEKAEKYLNQLKTELPKSEVRNTAYAEIRLKWNKVNWTYYDQIGDIQKAYAHLETYHALLDSLESHPQAFQFLDIETAFKNREQQYQLSLMRSKNKINSIYLKVIVGFTLLAVVFLIVARYNLKRSKSINRVISQQNIELQETLGALEQSQAENTKIMYMVAHDLRNPISSMVMMSDILLEDEKIEEDSRVLLEHIKTSGNHSLNLVKEMMQSNKNTENLKKELLEMDRMLHYCVELLHHKAQEKDQTLILEASPVIVNVSREKIWRVISNLIANAIKFSPKGSDIRIGMKNNPDQVLITVKDQGIGIPDSIKEKVFELYTDGKREGTEGEKPFGMGLAISRQIISAHKGEIWFESQEGKGTTFFVALPKEEKTEKVLGQVTK
ncbi:MAG: ATP-binding protein [Cyclobacteriaceae bacterium]